MYLFKIRCFEEKSTGIGISKYQERNIDTCKNDIGAFLHFTILLSFVFDKLKNSRLDKTFFWWFPNVWTIMECLDGLFLLLISHFINALGGLFGLWVVFSACWISACIQNIQERSCCESHDLIMKTPVRFSPSHLSCFWGFIAPLNTLQVSYHWFSLYKMSY